MGEVSNLFDSSLEESRLWRFGDDFTVANCYASLDIGGLLAFPHKQVWNPKVPLKVSFLIWSICHDGAPTLDMLLRAGLIQNDICLLCDTEQETQNHLFLHCSETRKLWRYFLDNFKLLWVFSDSVKRNVWEWSSFKCRSFKRKLWSILPFAIWWTVWNERNNRLYMNQRRNID